MHQVGVVGIYRTIDVVRSPGAVVGTGVAILVCRIAAAYAVVHRAIALRAAEELFGVAEQRPLPGEIHGDAEYAFAEFGVVGLHVAAVSGIGELVAVGIDVNRADIQAALSGAGTDINIVGLFRGGGSVQHILVVGVPSHEDGGIKRAACEFFAHSIL